MAFDEKLAQRIRSVLSEHSGVSERKMFGGIAFLINGNMCCGVHGSELIVRLPDGEARLHPRHKDSRMFDMHGKKVKDWLLVDSDGVRTRALLASWVELAYENAARRPPK